MVNFPLSMGLDNIEYCPIPSIHEYFKNISVCAISFFMYVVRLVMGISLPDDVKLNCRSLNSINQDTLDHARNLDIEDRMECHSEQNAFLNIKDHKEGFPNSIKCRVINPASNNLGKVSKRILDKINKSCRDATEANQWKSTQDVLQWFASVHSNNPTKKKAKLLQFDICEFYPSISEDLLLESLDFAKTHAKIEEEEVKLIMNCRKSVLFNSGNVWTKKDRDVDVTMGAQDGAEIAELTGIYLLKQVNEFLSSLDKRSHAGLYRDDGLIYIEDANGPLISKIEKLCTEYSSAISSTSVSSRRATR